MARYDKDSKKSSKADLFAVYVERLLKTQCLRYCFTKRTTLNHYKYGLSNNATVRAFTEDNPGDPPLTTLRRANGDDAPIPTLPEESTRATLETDPLTIKLMPPPDSVKIVVSVFDPDPVTLFSLNIPPV